MLAPNIRTIAMCHHSPLRYPGHAHALIDALTFGEKGWTITLCAVAEAADSKAWIERLSCFRSGPRVIQRTEQRQCSGEHKMRHGIISVGFDAAEEPADCFSVCFDLQLGVADCHQPPEGEDIARREAKCFVDMGLSLCPAPHKILGNADFPVRVSQIAIQRQRSLALS